MYKLNPYFDPEAKGKIRIDSCCACSTECFDRTGLSDIFLNTERNFFV